MQCIEKVYRWALVGRIPRERIRFVFEEGDIGKGLLMALLNDSGYPKATFEYKKDTYDRKRGIRPAFVPLQAADLLAHALFEETRDGRMAPLRVPYVDLENKPGHVGVITDEDVAQYVLYLHDTAHLGRPLFVQ
jgi:hypothetical protein